MEACSYRYGCYTDQTYSYSATYEDGSISYEFVYNYGEILVFHAAHELPGYVEMCKGKLPHSIEGGWREDCVGAWVSCSLDYAPGHKVLCPGMHEGEYCDARWDCVDNSWLCECGTAIRYCWDMGFGHEFFLCEGKHVDEYCDGYYDCNTGSGFCDCADAQRICY